MGMDGGGRDLARKGFHSTNNGFADGKDVVVRLLQCVSFPNSFKIDAIIV